MTRVHLDVGGGRAYIGDRGAFVAFDLLRDPVYTDRDVARMFADSGEPGDEQRLIDAVATARRMVADRDALPADPLAHPCPRCHAPAGRGCTSTATGQTRPPHTERKDAR